MTIGERKVISVAVMECGCEYVTTTPDLRPPSRCPEHGAPYKFTRYDSEKPVRETGQ